MPTQNARKHVIPSGSEQSVSRATIFETFGNSIRDVVPVATTTERSQVVSALTTAGQGPTAARPLVVYRADAPGLHKLEVTADGTLWVGVDGSLRFVDVAAQTAWTTANPGLLVAGDRAWTAGLEWIYSGTAWLLAPGQRLAYMTANSGQGTVDQIIGTVASTIALPVGQRVKVRCARVSGSAVNAGVIQYSLVIRNNASDVTPATKDKELFTGGYQGGGGFVIAIPGTETEFVTTAAAKVSAAIVLRSGVWTAHGPYGQELWIESF